MSIVKSSGLKWSTLGFTLAAFVAFGRPMCSQTSPAVRVGGAKITGTVDDWSHHHLVFSNPGTEQEAIKSGHLKQWQKIVNDPRYVMQQLRRNLPVQGPAAVDTNYRRGLLTEAHGLPNAAPASNIRSFGPINGIERRGKPPITDKKQKINPPSAIKADWNESLGSAAAPSPLAYPAKWSFDSTTASCANDFVVYPTGQAGSATQASIIAYYNLYDGGCTSGPVPSVDWAYNTGGNVSLAPEFSANGNQVAFIQSSGGVASLVLLTFPLTPPGTGTLGSPITPAAQTASSYYNGGAGCTAPCSYTVALNPGSVDDTWSDPYYDYGTDSLYVGDSAGVLHKFSPVFNGVPAEVVGSGTNWPTQLANTVTDPNQVASPVYDPTSGVVLVGTTTDNNANPNTGGFLYAVNGATGAITAYSGQLDENYGIQDAVLLDPVAEQAYVFVGYTPTTFSGGAGASSNAVIRFSLNPLFSTGSIGTSLNLGGAGNGGGLLQLSGTFDNAYYTSANAQQPTGNLYVCSSTTPATLYQIAITNGAMGTLTAGPAIGNGGLGALCSPVTEFFNSSPGFATGMITIATNPATWTLPQTVTIGGTTYTFTTTAGVNNVVAHTSQGALTNEILTARNFEAVIMNNSADCTTNGEGDPGCVAAGQTANASASATVAGNVNNGSKFSNVVDLTATTAGPAGNFSLATGNATNFTLSGGNNGTTEEDLLFLSVYGGTPTGCAGDEFDGCLMSFNVTPASLPANLTTLTPGGVMDLNELGFPANAPTGGIIIDNAATNLTGGGASQIYFLTTAPDPSDPCIPGASANGVCAVQASQSAPF